MWAHPASTASKTDQPRPCRILTFDTLLRMCRTRPLEQELWMAIEISKFDNEMSKFEGDALKFHNDQFEDDLRKS